MFRIETQFIDAIISSQSVTPVVQVSTYNKWSIFLYHKSGGLKKFWYLGQDNCPISNLVFETNLMGCGSGTITFSKLPIAIDADDFFMEVLDNRGYEGKDFDELIAKAGKILGDNLNNVIMAHDVRNSIVYDPDYKLSAEQGKKILDIYEVAINSVGMT